MKIDKNKLFKKIIIIRTDRIGEVLLATVAIDAIIRKYPDCRISFATSRYSKPLLENRDDIENIYLVDTFTKSNEMTKALDFSKVLKKEAFDAAIILNPHKSLHLACFMAGIPYRIGFDRKWGFLLNVKKEDSRDQGNKHEIAYTMDLLHLIDKELTAIKPHICVDNISENKVSEILRGKGADKKRALIAVHPGSSNVSKIWGVDKYAELIKRLKDSMDCDIAVLGTEEESRITSNIIRKANTEVLDFTSELNLKELAALLSKCTLFVGNDAGPMHMASVLDIPVVAIFGRNIAGVGPKRWGPLGARNIVFHKDPGCRPCQDMKCINNYRCMSLVTVEMVYDAVIELMGPWVLEHK